MAVRTHDEVIRKVRAVARSADRKALASAFVASLGEKPGFWRSVLGALAAAEAVPTHAYKPFSRSSPDCRECGLLPKVEPAELSTRGDDLPGDLASALAILEQARKANVPVAKAADGKRLKQILATVGTLPADARESRLNDAIRKAKIVVGNKYDVRAVIEALGACGVLQTPEHPGFSTKWTSFAARQDRPSSRVESDPPIAFWTVGHGVDAANVKRWFGSLGITAPAASKPRKAAVAKVSKGMTAREKRAARSTELELGDVVAFAVGSTWLAARVIGHHRDMGGRVPVLERLAWRGTSAPSLDDVRKAKSERVTSMMDLWKREDRGGRWTTIGTLPTPKQDVGGYIVTGLRRDGSGLARFAGYVARED